MPIRLTRGPRQVAIRLLIAKEEAAWILGKRGTAGWMGMEDWMHLGTLWSENGDKNNKNSNNNSNNKHN